MVLTFFSNCFPVLKFQSHVISSSMGRMWRNTLGDVTQVSSKCLPSLPREKQIQSLAKVRDLQVSCLTWQAPAVGWWNVCLPPCGLAESAINKQIPTTTITQHPRIIKVPYFYPHLRRIRRVQLNDSNNDEGGSHSRPSSQGKTKLLFYVAAQWKLGRVKILASFCLWLFLFLLKWCMMI